MTQAHEQPRKKRPYQRPAIKSSEAFERLALACSGTSSRAQKNPPNPCVAPAGS